jgi:hypothetical protein
VRGAAKRTAWLSLNDNSFLAFTLRDLWSTERADDYEGVLPRTWERVRMLTSALGSIFVKRA